MNSKRVRPKSVALSLRGFELAPEQVESIVGLPVSEAGTKGERAKPGVKTLLKRSFVRFAIEFPDTCRIDEMIPALLAKLGGVSHLCEVRDRVLPEFFEIDLTLPVKNSEDQEGGFLPPSTLADLSRLRASLSFQFI